MSVQTSRSYRRGVNQITKAYSVGAFSYLTPRLLSLIFARIRRGRNTRDKSQLLKLTRFLRETLEVHRFPVFCGFTVALHNILRPFLERLLSVEKFDAALLSRQTLASFSSGALSAVGGLRLLNTRQPGHGHAGRTLDLTLFALARATDIVVGELWQRRKDRRIASGKFTKLDSAIGNMTDSVIFALGSGIIMYAWFYSPERLPVTYKKQINHAAGADERLVETLRQIRSGKFIYGVNTGQPPLLESYCEDLGLPKEWGNPEKTIPIPCEVVHGGKSKSCELFALGRFWSATWKMAFPLYLGIYSLRFLRFQKPQAAAILSALAGAVRSSAFLGSFVGLFWYAICLTRTRLGPKFLSLDRLSLENLCVKMGCLLCGWSILVEHPQRRMELMFFVLPKVLSVLLPRKYDRKYEWIEETTFAVSVGVILATLKHKPQRVRGIFGELLGTILSD